MSILSSGWQAKLPRVPVEQWANSNFRSFLNPLARAWLPGYWGVSIFHFFCFAPKQLQRNNTKMQWKCPIWNLFEQNKKVLDRFGTKIWRVNSPTKLHHSAKQPLSELPGAGAETCCSCGKKFTKTGIVKCLYWRWMSTFFIGQCRLESNHLGKKLLHIKP